MKIKVRVEVLLDIDVSNENEALEVIQECNYNFSFKSGNFDSTGTEREKELITFSEIKNVEIV